MGRITANYGRSEASCTKLIYLGETEFYLIRLKSKQSENGFKYRMFRAFAIESFIAVFSDILNGVVRYFDHSSVISIG